MFVEQKFFALQLPISRHKRKNFLKSSTFTGWENYADQIDFKIEYSTDSWISRHFTKFLIGQRDPRLTFRIENVKMSVFNSPPIYIIFYS